jgi:hypothetical protein
MKTASNPCFGRFSRLWTPIVGNFIIWPYLSDVIIKFSTPWNIDIRWMALFKVKRVNVICYFRKCWVFVAVSETWTPMILLSGFVPTQYALKLPKLTMKQGVFDDVELIGSHQWMIWALERGEMMRSTFSPVVLGGLFEWVFWWGSLPRKLHLLWWRQSGVYIFKYIYFDCLRGVNAVVCVAEWECSCEGLGGFGPIETHTSDSRGELMGMEFIYRVYLIYLVVFPGVVKGGGGVVWKYAWWRPEHRNLTFA